MDDNLVERLWGSDAASALTNEAAREIEHLEGMVDRLISAINALDLTPEQKTFVARKINTPSAPPPLTTP